MIGNSASIAKTRVATKGYEFYAMARRTYISGEPITNVTTVNNLINFVRDYRTNFLSID